MRTKKQRNKVTSLLRTSKKIYVHDLTITKGNSKYIWKAINQLKNKNAASSSSFAKDISTDELNTHFSTIADKVLSVDRTTSNDLLVLKDFCDTKNVQSAPPIPPMTIAEVFSALVHLIQPGTHGLDDLDGKILKLSAPVICDTLTYIYNICIEKCSIPVAFKQAKVIPLFESGNCSNPSIYRPISILSVISKPLERHK